MKKNPLTAIVKRALTETVANIGQITPAQRRELEYAVKHGVLAKGRGGPFPILKTVYAVERLHYAKRDGFFIWESDANYSGPLPMQDETILIDSVVYEIGLDSGDGHGATLTPLGPDSQYDYDYDISDLADVCSVQR